MNSMRNRLVLLLLLGLTSLCVVGGLLAYRAVYVAVLSEFDYSLHTKVHDFAVMTEQEHGQINLEFAEKPMPEFEYAEHPEYYQVTLPDGTVVARSPSLASAGLTLPKQGVSESPRIYYLNLPRGVHGRAAALSVVVDGMRVNIIVARDTVRLDRFFRLLAFGFSGATLLLLLVFAVGLNSLVHRELRPLEIFAERVAAVKPGEDSACFSVANLPMELYPIAIQLDDLLERMVKTLERERYLTAAMAHELNTPIAELRTAAEVALKWPDDDGVAFAEVANAIALQMQQVVHALLSLSSHEVDPQKITVESIRVEKLLDASFRSVEAHLREKKIKVSKDWEGGLEVETNRAMLAVVLDNLFRNAADHTPFGGTLSVWVEGHRKGNCIILENRQEALIESDLEHLFDPLWCKDIARTGTTHSGLGLAVARRFCKLLGMELSVTLPKPDCFQITLSLKKEV